MLNRMPITRTHRMRTDVTAVFLMAGLASTAILINNTEYSPKKSVFISLGVAFLAGGLTRGAHAINNAVTDAREAKEAQRRSRAAIERDLRNGCQ